MDYYPTWSNGNRVVYGGGGGGVVASVGGEWWLRRREKWVKHYSSEHQILLVGEGDFSFSLSLAMGFGSASNIVATSLDSYDTLQRNYVSASANLEILRSLGATLLHGVDATKMSYHMEIKYYKKFDRIVFNFPHAGFYGKEDNPLMIEMHKDLLRGFFSNARLLLQRDGEIHVSHKNTAPYCDWNLEHLARENSLHLLERVPFKIADYPNYQNKRGHGPDVDITFNLGDCSTFKFTVSALIASLFNFNKSTNHLISNDQISVKTNTVINRDPFIPRDSINFNVGMRKSLPLLKFIVKGSLRFYPRAAGFAGALMDPENSIIAIFYGPVFHYDSNFVELLAIKHALVMFARSHLRGKVALVVESGLSDAVSWIKSDMGNPRELQAVVNEIRGALGRIGNADVCCKYREYGVETHQNVVDTCTKLGFRENSTVERWY